MAFYTLKELKPRSSLEFTVCFIILPFNIVHFLPNFPPNFPTRLTFSRRVVRLSRSEQDKDKPPQTALMSRSSGAGCGEGGRAEVAAGVGRPSNARSGW